MTASESSHQIHWELGNLLKVSTIDGSLDQTWEDIGVSLAGRYVGSWRYTYRMCPAQVIFCSVDEMEMVSM